MIMTYLHAFDSAHDRTYEKTQSKKNLENFFPLCYYVMCYLVVWDLIRYCSTWKNNMGSARTLSFLCSFSSRTRRQDYHRKILSFHRSSCLMRRIECGAQLKQKKLLTNFVHLLNYTFTFIRPPLELDMSRYVHTLSGERVR